jgi:hypothetical protein
MPIGYYNQSGAPTLGQYGFWSGNPGPLPYGLDPSALAGLMQSQQQGTASALASLASQKQARASRELGGRALELQARESAANRQMELADRLTRMKAERDRMITAIQEAEKDRGLKREFYAGEMAERGAERASRVEETAKSRDFQERMAGLERASQAGLAKDKLDFAREEMAQRFGLTREQMEQAGRLAKKELKFRKKESEASRGERGRALDISERQRAEDVEFRNRQFGFQQEQAGKALDPYTASALEIVGRGGDPYAMRQGLGALSEMKTKGLDAMSFMDATSGTNDPDTAKVALVGAVASGDPRQDAAAIVNEALALRDPARIKAAIEQAAQNALASEGYKFREGAQEEFANEISRLASQYKVSIAAPESYMPGESMQERITPWAWLAGPAAVPYYGYRSGKDILERIFGE